MKWACLMVVTIGVSAALAAPEIDDAKKDLEKMKGTWKAVSGEANGNPLPGFGQIGSTQVPNREIQFAIKFTW